MLDAAVDVFLVLADDDDIHAGMLGVDVGVVGDARAHVRVQAEHLPGGDVQALEAAALRRRDRRLQEHLRAAQRLPRARLDAGTVAAQVDLLADFDGLDVEPAPASFRIWRVASMISGPMPSPWATVIGVLVDIWVETTKLTSFPRKGKRREPWRRKRRLPGGALSATSERRS